jgi:hypothetical protein
MNSTRRPLGTAAGIGRWLRLGTCALKVESSGWPRRLAARRRVSTCPLRFSVLDCNWTLASTNRLGSQCSHCLKPPRLSPSRSGCGPPHSGAADTEANTEEIEPKCRPTNGRETSNDATCVAPSAVSNSHAKPSATSDIKSARYDWPWQLIQPQPGRRRSDAYHLCSVV